MTTVIIDNCLLAKKKCTSLIKTDNENVNFLTQFCLGKEYLKYWLLSNIQKYLL